MSSGEGDGIKVIQKIPHAKQICYGLQSEAKNFRKQCLVNLQEYLSTESFTQQELRDVFNETQMYTLNAFRDKSEAVREQAIKFMTFFLLEKLNLNDYYLTYLFPILIERIGTVELVEESEEIRWQLVQFLHSVILKYSNTEQLKPFLNDIVIILCETVKDKYPKLKEDSCKCITTLAQALPRDFHLQAESFIKPVLSAFGHQRYKVRVEAIKCMGDIVMNSSCKGLEEAVGPMAERLFDQIPVVRQTVAQVAAHWLLQYRDRYSFFHKLLPLILTGLNDEVSETRAEATRLWEAIGLQFQRENEKDLKEQMDFLTDDPKYYPKDLIRPNLGCRVLVQRNVIKISGALAKELGSWQGDIKVRCSQLLCALALHAEGGLTQHLQDLLPAMYLAAQDEDQRVVVNIIRASELIGLFVPVDAWIKLVILAIDDGVNYGQLAVLAGLIRGTPQEYIESSLETISELLAEPIICHSRKPKFQREQINCGKAILEKYKPNSSKTGYNLFTILITVVSLKDAQNEDISIDLLDDLYKILGFQSRYELWSKYVGGLLENIKSDPVGWSVITPECCIFETILLESGQAFGENLPQIGNILAEALELEADPQTRLKTFIALSSTLQEKDKILQQSTNLNNFLELLVTDILVPTLVWHAGGIAEAMRTMAASCLCCALNPGVEVDLFSASDMLQPFVDKLLPLLLSLIEDASSRSRQLALENLALIKETCGRRGIWDADYLLKVYPEIIKRLDDPTDKVRISATKSLGSILKDSPDEFKKGTYQSHHELLIATLLVHFDDDDEHFQELIYENLKAVANINGQMLLEKVKIHKSLLRNQKGCDRVTEYLMDLNITDK